MGIKIVKTILELLRHSLTLWTSALAATQKDQVLWFSQKSIRLLMVLLALGFCWCHRIGEWQNEFKPIKIKNMVAKRSVYSAMV